MKHLSLRMLFLLSIILIGSSSIYGQSAVSPEGADAYVYSLVSDASSLAAGDQFVIVNEESSVAMGAQNTNNRAKVDVTITDHTISELPENRLTILNTGAKRTDMSPLSGNPDAASMLSPNVPLVR